MKILLPFSMHSAASKGKNDNPKDKLPPCYRSINDKYCNKKMILHTLCLCKKVFPIFETSFNFFRLPYLIVDVYSSTVQQIIFNSIYTLIQDFSEGGRVDQISKKSCIQPGVFFQNMTEVYSEIMQYFTKFDVCPTP